MKLIPRPFVFLIAAVGLPFVIGCGSKHAASITGQVTLDGKPLDRGTVTFHPVAGGAVAYGQIDADGNYAVKTGRESGLVPGRYRVTVVSAGPPSKGQDESPGELFTPVRYGRLEETDLEFEITAGANSIDVRLTSDES